MKIKKLNSLFQNNLFVFILSLFISVVIWLLVVINVSPQTTRVIKDVKVTIDDTVPSQFGLEVFGESEFLVDVTVKGKKYQISSGTLSAEDIVVTAVTTNVDSPGFRTLQLRAEPVSENASYTISGVSAKTVDVYFDTAKSVQFPVEPEIITDGFPIVKDGFTCGQITLSEASVVISGPSTQVNRIEKVVARYSLEKSLDSNMSAETQIIPLDDKNKSDFDYLTMSVEKTVLAVPVLRVKTVDTAVTFKNAPNAYVSKPLGYTISPAKESFNIFVDDYEKTTDYTVGTIDFKALSPTNNRFVFDTENLAVAEGGAKEFVVLVDMSNFSQEFMAVSSDKIKINNPDKVDYKVSDFKNSVIVVGPETDIKALTKDAVSVEIDLSQVDIQEGETVTVPAIVKVNSDTCWIYGTYEVQVTL
ncbi:MAG: hypothetical protein IJ025_01660 [Clostridia bacterium]|nr:hypothetical protein [Clostridia bacterium]